MGGNPVTKGIPASLIPGCPLKFTPVIDRTYPLRETPEALRYAGKGHVQGKVVITLDHQNKT
jgi:hypothetical protein